MNTVTNNMSMDIKLRNAQLSKIIRSKEFLGALLDKLIGPLMKVAVLLAKNVLALLTTMASASVIDGAIQRKIACARSCKNWKRNHFSHFE